MIVFGVSGVINRALSVLLIPLYTSHILPREYGALALLMIILSAVPIVLRIGLNNALLRSWYDYEESERPKLATTVFVFLLATSIPILVTLALFAPQLSSLFFESEKYALHMRIVLALSFLEIFNVVPDALLRARNSSIQYALSQTVGFLVQLCTIIGLVKYANFGIKGVLLGNLIGSTLQNSMMFAYSFRQMAWGFNFTELKVMLSFGYPLIFGRLAAICFQSIDRFFLNYYANLRIVGLYALGNQLASPITMLITTPFGMIWANMQFSTMKDSDSREYYARMLTYVVYAGVLLALPAAILVEDVLRIFAPLKYWEAARVVPWLAAAAVLDAATTVLNVGISIKRKTFINPVIVISAALINVAFNFLLIPSFGMMGAAIATVFSYAAMAIFRYYVSNSLLPIRYEWERLLKIALVCFALFMLSRAIDIERPIYSFCAKMPLALVFPFILIPLKFYDAKEWKRAGELIGKVRKYGSTEVQRSEVGSRESEVGSEKLQ